MGMGATTPGGATPNTGSAQPSNVNTPAPGGKGGGITGAINSTLGAVKPTLGVAQQVAQPQPMPQWIQNQPAQFQPGQQQYDPVTMAPLPPQGGMAPPSNAAPGGKGGMQADPRVMSSISPQQGGGMFGGSGLSQTPQQALGDRMFGIPQNAEEMAQMRQNVSQLGQLPGGKGGMPQQGSPLQAYYAQQLPGGMQGGQMPPQQGGRPHHGGMPHHGGGMFGGQMPPQQGGGMPPQQQQRMATPAEMARSGLSQTPQQALGAPTPEMMARAQAMQQQNLMQRQQPQQQNPMMDALTLHSPDYYQNQPQVQLAHGPIPGALSSPTMAQTMGGGMFGGMSKQDIMAQAAGQQVLPGAMTAQQAYAQSLQGGQAQPMPMPPPGMLPQNPGQMPAPPMQQPIAQPNQQQMLQRAMQQFTPGMTGQQQAQQLSQQTPQQAAQLAATQQRLMQTGK